MACSCTSAIRGGETILRGAGSIDVVGSGTPSDPYIITEAAAGNTLAFSVNDSATVNLQLTGSGSTADPYVLRADTSSASQLRGLGDVAATPVATQGTVPLWMGTTVGGHFELRTPGTRYTTSTTRGNGLYQGEVARDTDTGKRYEWDGGQWVSLDVSIPSFALDPSVLQNGGSISAATDWNTLTTTARVYQVTAVSSTNNSPAGAVGTGSLEVLISGTSISQVYTSTANISYQRIKSGSTWSTWSALASSTDIAALTTALNSEITNRGTAVTGVTTALAAKANQSDVTALLGAVSPLTVTSTKPQYTQLYGDWSVTVQNFYRSGYIYGMFVQLLRVTGGTAFPSDIALGYQLGSITFGWPTQGGFITGYTSTGGVAAGHFNANQVILDSLSVGVPAGATLTLAATWIAQ